MGKIDDEYRSSIRLFLAANPNTRNDVAAEKFFVCIKVISQIRKQYGIPSTSGQVSAKTKEAVRVFLSANPSTSNLVAARKFGVSTRICRQVREHYGIPSNPPFREPTSTLRIDLNRRESIRLFLAANPNVRNIVAAEKFYVSTCFISQMRKEHGIPSPYRDRFSNRRSQDVR